MSVIYIDMDNVVVDLNRAVVERVNQIIGTNHKPEDTKDWWWSNLGVSQEFLNDILCEPYIFEEAKPMIGDIQGINRLKDYGLDIVFLTTPHYDSDYSMEEKKRWLEWKFDWFDPYKNLIFSGRKGLVGTRDDYIIDDSINNLKGFKGLSICYDAPWNKEYDGIRFDNWRDMVDYIIYLEEHSRK